MPEPLRAFPVGDTLYQILFTSRDADRLNAIPGRTDRLEQVELVHCHIYDDQMFPVALGMAVCADDDEFSYPRGARIALARALDDAEASIADWTRDVSIDVLHSLHESWPATKAPDSAWDAIFDDYWDIDFDAPDYHTQVAKLIAPYIDMPTFDGTIVDVILTDDGPMNVQFGAASTLAASNPTTITEMSAAYKQAAAKVDAEREARIKLDAIYDFMEDLRNL